jgi:hypothetical protein
MFTDVSEKLTVSIFRFKDQANQASSKAQEVSRGKGEKYIASEPLADYQKTRRAVFRHVAAVLLQTVNSHSSDDILGTLLI